MSKEEIVEPMEKEEEVKPTEEKESPSEKEMQKPKKNKKFVKRSMTEENNETIHPSKKRPTNFESYDLHQLSQKATANPEEYNPAKEFKMKHVNNKKCRMSTWGLPSLYGGKPLFRILNNLKNFGIGRIVYKTTDYERSDAPFLL
ncbi:unnamed protein product [Lepeophtheirus salmonis]|uniref:(salmon louse) hypothetical protein n=1 Tax=Lepeophtheirus salmonis TaxID=72036 RepID=A0A7R8H265_LEPSM|nr:unnamed protein product [Lepeophtheirus salmonis]CAF2808074.1 unnamed protein product [Lepeophtheirus salmonis]